MQLTLSIFALLVLIASPAYAQELKKLNLDDASTIRTTIQTDTQLKALVMPAIGASTTGGSTTSGPMRSGANSPGAAIVTPRFTSET